MKIFDWLSKAFDKKPIFVTYNSRGGTVKQMTSQALYYGIVYSCVDAIASAVCAVDFSLYKKDDRGELNEIQQEHDAVKLLKRPNDFMSGTDLMYVTSAHIDAHGKAYWYLVKSGTKKIVEIWPLNPAKTFAVRDKDFIAGYGYVNPKGETITFETSEIIEIKRPNPYDIYEGVSTIEMARYAQEGDYFSIQWNKNFFANGAMPSGVLSTPQNMSVETFNMVKNEWRKNYEGVDNAHKTAILSAGLDFKAITPKQKDMDYLEQRRFSRDEILSIFKVPKTIVAITDDVNRANAETSEYVFAKRVVKPRLDLIYEKLNQFYLPRFVGTESLELKYESPVPEDNQFELLRKQGSVNKWLTINEVRAEDGYEGIEGGDNLYDANGLPIGTDVVTDNTLGKSITKTMKRMTKKDRELLIKRNKYLLKKEREYKAKLGLHYRTLLRDVRKRSVNKEFEAKIKDLSLSEVAQELTPNFENWRQLLVQINIDFGLDVLKQAIKDTGETYELPHDFDLEHSGAIAWLKNEATEAANDVTTTMKERIRQIIATNLEDGNTSLSDIQDDVYETLGEEEDFRIDRIARTELISAYNQGSYQEYRSSGVVEKIKWITGDDEMVCKVCRENDGEVIDFTDDFPSGDNQPPAHPNCRCSIVPMFD